MNRNESPIDVRHVVCNLMPTLLGHLDLAREQHQDTVEFLIRQGIQQEMRSAFGTVGVWRIEIETHIGHDLLRFQRAGEERNLPDLNLLDY
ncbi:MAG: hypothetical protein V3573_08495 [Desulfovibrionaceae bacterium]